jgi:hypothetical protein
MHSDRTPETIRTGVISRALLNVSSHSLMSCLEQYQTRSKLTCSVTERLCAIQPKTFENVQALIFIENVTKRLETDYKNCLYYNHIYIIHQQFRAFNKVWSLKYKSVPPETHIHLNILLERNLHNKIADYYM